MKYVDENELRKAAREATKTITTLGSPWGPNEAFVAGAKFMERKYKEVFFELEAELHDLRKKVVDHDTKE